MKSTLRLTRAMAPYRYAPIGYVRLANQTAKALNGYEPVADRRTFIHA
ncbi:MAG: hypothetical protein NVS1B10_05900 [Candidatus Saccharimonadales bacterium]